MDKTHCQHSNPTKDFPPNFKVTPGRTKIFLNPGRLTNLHNRIEAITPEWLEGISIYYNQSILPCLATRCEYILSHTSPTGLRVGGLYCYRPYYGDILRTPNIQFDTNPNTLCSNLMFLYQPFSSTRLKGIVQTNFQKLFSYAVSFDIIRTSSTTNFTISQFNEKSTKIDISFIEAYNSRLALGGQLVFDKDKDDMLKAQLGIGARYSLDKSALSMTLLWRSIHLSYWTQITDRLQFGTKMEYDEKSKKFLGGLVYQLESSDSCIRGQFNSDLSIGVTYNRRYRSTNCGGSIYLCIPTNKFVLGFKFDYDPSVDL